MYLQNNSAILSSFIQTSSGSIGIIKNGYAYKYVKDKYGFVTLEKYKINPAVYGK